MKKKSIEIIGSSTGLPKIVGIKATGNQVVVERLNKNETMNTKLYVGESTYEGPPQAYVLDIGPLVSPDCGFKVGDRVLLSGAYTPAPKFDDSDRERGCLLPDMIKAVLIEE